MRIGSFFSFFSRCNPKPASITFTQSKDGLSVRIETARLILRSITPKDTDAYTKLHADKEVVRLYASGEPQSKDKVRDRINDIWVKRWKNNDPYSALAVFSKATNEFLGHAILGHGDRPGQSEAAMLIHKQAWDRKYGTEMAHALKDYASATVQKGYLLEGKPLDEVVATARTDNAPVIKILKHLGMQITHTSEKFGSLRHHYSIKLYTEKNAQKTSPSLSGNSNASSLATEPTNGKMDQGRASSFDFGLSRIYSLFVSATDQIADTLRAVTHRMLGVVQ